MSRNKNALYDANDIHTLASSAVQNAKARRAVALQEAELEQATGGAIIGVVTVPIAAMIPIIFGMIFIPKLPFEIQ
jgi:hypothetical protein